MMLCYYSNVPTSIVWQQIKFPWTAIENNYIKLEDHYNKHYYVILEDKCFENRDDLFHYVKSKLIEARITTQEFFDALEDVDWEPLRERE